MTTKLKRWLDGGEGAPEGAVTLLSFASAPPPMSRAEWSKSSIAIAMIAETARMLKQWALRVAVVTAATVFAALGGLWLAAERPQPPAAAQEADVVTASAKSSVDPVPELQKNTVGASAKHTTKNPTEHLPPALEMPALRSVHQEAQLLENARKALSTDPHEAMSYVRAHAADFPTGTLIAEREFLTIVALSLTGQPEHASRRALDFQRLFPGSSYQGQLSHFLE